MIGFKFQAQIRHINGDIITTIWDNNKKRFYKEVEKWESENTDENLFVEIV